jgi:hypothetical protein
VNEVELVKEERIKDDKEVEHIFESEEMMGRDRRMKEQESESLSGL